MSSFLCSVFLLYDCTNVFFQLENTVSFHIVLEMRRSLVRHPLGHSEILMAVVFVVILFVLSAEL